MLVNKEKKKYVQKIDISKQLWNVYMNLKFYSINYYKPITKY